MDHNFKNDAEQLKKNHDYIANVEGEYLTFQTRANHAIKTKIPNELKMKQESLNEQKRETTKLVDSLKNTEENFINKLQEANDKF